MMFLQVIILLAGFLFLVKGADEEVNRIYSASYSLFTDIF